MKGKLLLIALLLVGVVSLAQAGWDYGLKPYGSGQNATIMFKDRDMRTDVLGYLNDESIEYESASPTSLGTAFGIREIGALEACIAFVDEDVRDDVLNNFLNQGGIYYEQVITVVDTTEP